LGAFAFDEYYELEPEVNDPDDEGYGVDEHQPMVEYDGIEYPVYTDISNLDNYIMLNDENGEDVMVKTSAVAREKRK
jgi:hypothetical protein